MDYEKKYKELVGKIEKAYLYAQTDSTKAVLEEIRPELKSEDERIRRFLHHTFTAQYLCKDKLGKWHGEPVVNILAWLEKQGDKSFNYENANIQQKDFAPKVEPKFKVKYAGREYNVLDIKDVAGVTFYGIEDEPNHIDYVQAENCERVGGYSIKEDGSPFPTQPAKFSEQKPAWSEDDEMIALSIEQVMNCASLLNIVPEKIDKIRTWLKSLKERMGG